MPVKEATEFIEIDESPGEDDNICFTLDFDKCSKCVKDFSSNEAAMMHYNNKHPDEMQICPECNSLLATSRQMLYHFKTKHSEVVVPIYLKSVRSVGYGETLFEEFTANRCSICKLEFKTRADAQTHFNEDHELAFKCCSVCSKNFRYESQLKKHWEQCHKDMTSVDLNAEISMEVCLLVVMRTNIKYSIEF